jgi:hypothetical protein
MPDDQTPDEWLDLPAVANDPRTLGTGLYLERVGARKEKFSDVTYDDTRDQANRRDFHAFKWVPHSIASETQLDQDVCQARCSRRCFRPGCLCDRGEGRCK